MPDLLPPIAKALIQTYSRFTSFLRTWELTMFHDKHRRKRGTAKGVSERAGGLSLQPLQLKLQRKNEKGK